GGLCLRRSRRRWLVVIHQVRIASAHVLSRGQRVVAGGGLRLGLGLGLGLCGLWTVVCGLRRRRLIVLHEIGIPSAHLLGGRKILFFAHDTPPHGCRTWTARAL